MVMFHSYLSLSEGIPAVPLFKDQICMDLPKSDSQRLKGKYIDAMGDLLGILNHGLFIHAHGLLGKPVSGKIEWCRLKTSKKKFCKTLSTLSFSISSFPIARIGSLMLEFQLFFRLILSGLPQNRSQKIDPHGRVGLPKS